MKTHTTVMLVAVLAALAGAAPAAAQDALTPPGPLGADSPDAASMPETYRPALQTPGIVGADDRVPIDSKAWPWSAIGRVNRSNGGFCTGVLIGPRHVLTVAHCLYDRQRGRWVDVADLHFVAGYRRGEFVAHAVANEVIVSPEYRPEAPEERENLVHDWAVIVIRGVIGIPPIELQASFDVASIAGRNLIRAGYSQDRAHMLAADESCRIVGLDGGLLLHDCDATLGDSGSPILLRNGSGTVLVGLNVGIRESDRGTLGVALPVDNFEQAVRDVMLGKTTSG